MTCGKTCIEKNYEEKNSQNLSAGDWLLCREAKDAEDIAGQPDGAKDDHEDPNNPEPEWWGKTLLSQNVKTISKWTTENTINDAAQFMTHFANWYCIIIAIKVFLLDIIFVL